MFLGSLFQVRALKAAHDEAHEELRLDLVGRVLHEPLQEVERKKKADPVCLAGFCIRRTSFH